MNCEQINSSSINSSAFKFCLVCAVLFCSDLWQSVVSCWSQLRSAGLGLYGLAGWFERCVKNERGCRAEFVCHVKVYRSRFLYWLHPSVAAQTMWKWTAALKPGFVLLWWHFVRSVCRGVLIFRRTELWTRRSDGRIGLKSIKTWHLSLLQFVLFVSVWHFSALFVSHFSPEC